MIEKLILVVIVIGLTFALMMGLCWMAADFEEDENE